MGRPRDLTHWPNAKLSRFVRVRPHDWHIQEANRKAGNTVLLLHGAGSSTHTWRDVLPALARDRHVVAVDMPGQGFSQAGTLRRCGIERMSEDLCRLILDQGWVPATIIGHSAGAALALQMVCDGMRECDPKPMIIGVNAALNGFEGVAGWLFPVLAKALALNPLTSLLFTAGGNPKARARRLIEGTGSQIDQAGLDCYARLIGDRHHVDATLQMMSQWNVDRLVDRARDLPNRCLLISADLDRAVLPKVSEEATSVMANAQHVAVTGFGHLFHEEAPEAFLELITKAQDLA